VGEAPERKSCGKGASTRAVLGEQEDVEVRLAQREVQVLGQQAFQRSVVVTGPWVAAPALGQFGEARVGDRCEQRVPTGVVPVGRHLAEPYGFPTRRMLTAAEPSSMTIRRAASAMRSLVDTFTP
jgi:hypothetical protein